MALGFLKKFVAKISGAVAKTRERISGVLRKFTRKLDPTQLDLLQDTLIETDMGPRLAAELRLTVEEAYKRKQIQDSDGVRKFIMERLQTMMPTRE
jgi:signal recognition particle GTPase